MASGHVSPEQKLRGLLDSNWIMSVWKKYLINCSLVQISFVQLERSPSNVNKNLTSPDQSATLTFTVYTSSVKMVISSGKAISLFIANRKTLINQTIHIPSGLDTQCIIPQPARHVEKTSFLQNITSHLKQKQTVHVKNKSPIKVKLSIISQPHVALPVSGKVNDSATVNEDNDKTAHLRIRLARRKLWSKSGFEHEILRSMVNNGE